MSLVNSAMTIPDDQKVPPIPMTFLPLEQRTAYPAYELQAWDMVWCKWQIIDRDTDLVAIRKRIEDAPPAARGLYKIIETDNIHTVALPPIKALHEYCRYATLPSNAHESTMDFRLPTKILLNLHPSAHAAYSELCTIYGTLDMPRMATAGWWELDISYGDQKIRDKYTSNSEINWDAVTVACSLVSVDFYKYPADWMAGSEVPHPMRYSFNHLLAPYLFGYGNSIRIEESLEEGVKRSKDLYRMSRGRDRDY